ncbi:hypothetical protein L7F22_067240 [Adiantum nelumboides]|nr:hypothetical protein [Adiantum nelumboides]
MVTRDHFHFGRLSFYEPRSGGSPYASKQVNVNARGQRREQADVFLKVAKRRSKVESSSSCQKPNHGKRKHYAPWMEGVSGILHLMGLCDRKIEASSMEGGKVQGC